MDEHAAGVVILVGVLWMQIAVHAGAAALAWSAWRVFRHRFWWRLAFGFTCTVGQRMIMGGTLWSWAGSPEGHAMAYEYTVIHCLTAMVPSAIFIWAFAGLLFDAYRIRRVESISDERLLDSFTSIRSAVSAAQAEVDRLMGRASPSGAHPNGRH